MEHDYEDLKNTMMEKIRMGFGYVEPRVSEYAAYEIYMEGINEEMRIMRKHPMLHPMLSFFYNPRVREGFISNDILHEPAEFIAEACLRAGRYENPEDKMYYRVQAGRAFLSLALGFPVEADTMIDLVLWGVVYAGGDCYQ